MESLETNKAVAAVLVAGIAFVGAGQLANVLVHPKPLHEAAIKIEGVEQTAAAAPQGPQTPSQPIAVLLASADPAAGESLSKKLCTSCHSFNEGGKNGVGPNLHGVMGAAHAHRDDFQYSPALKGKQGPWTYEAMSDWLLSPRGYAAGTKMSFSGIGNDKQRADVIAYLRSVSPNAPPLPATPAAQPAAAPAAGQGASGVPTSGSPQQVGTNAPSSDGATRPQTGQVVGPAGQGQVQGQQMTQPAPSMNQSQTQTNQSQQPAVAQQVQDGAANQGADSNSATRPQTGRVVGPAGQGQVQGQQMTQPAPSMNQSQTETNQSQQPGVARQVQ